MGSLALVLALALALALTLTRHANVAHPPQGSRFARLTSDQQVLK